MALGKLPPRPADPGRAWRFGLCLWRSYHPPAFPSNRDQQRLRLDLDHAVMPSDFQWRAGLERGLAPDLAGNDQATGGVHGSNHGMDPTMPIGVPSALRFECAAGWIW